MTGAEWLPYRFGRLKSVEAVRVVKAVVAIVVTVVLLAYLVRGTSLFLGIITGAAMSGVGEMLPYWAAALTGIAAGAATWLLHRGWESQSLSKAEKNATPQVHFPRGWRQEPPQS